MTPLIAAILAAKVAALSPIKSINDMRCVHEAFLDLCNALDAVLVPAEAIVAASSKSRASSGDQYTADIIPRWMIDQLAEAFKDEPAPILPPQD